MTTTVVYRGSRESVQYTGTPENPTVSTIVRYRAMTHVLVESGISAVVINIFDSNNTGLLVETHILNEENPKLVASIENRMYSPVDNTVKEITFARTSKEK